MTDWENAEDREFIKGVGAILDMRVGEMRKAAEMFDRAAMYFADRLRALVDLHEEVNRRVDKKWSRE